MAGLEAGILEDIRLSRLRYRQRNEPVLEPQSPPRYNDFPGKPAQGDPNGVKKKVEYSAVNGPRWSNEQYHRFLHTAMEPRFPPVLKGIVETRLKSDQVVFERLEGFDDELDYITRSKRENTGKFEAWHKERSELEVALLHMAQELRKDHADQVESVYQAHHAHRHRRIPNSQYSSVKQHHVDEMEKLLSIIHKVAETIGILYAERGAVAQGVVPRHGDMYGKLDLAACKPTSYVKVIFPEFVEQPAPPVDNFGVAPDLPLPAQPGILNFYRLADAWEGGEAALGPLHEATLANRWSEVNDRSRAGSARARKMLGRS